MATRLSDNFRATNVRVWLCELLKVGTSALEQAKRPLHNEQFNCWPQINTD